MSVITKEIVVGKNGEILLKPELCAQLGLFPGDTIFIEALPEKVIIQKIHSIEEILKKS